MKKIFTYLIIWQGSLQEVIGWGLIGWKYYANVIGPIQCEGLANLGVMQIACAEKRFLILSRNGRVYTQAYNSDTLVGPGVGWWRGLSAVCAAYLVFLYVSWFLKGYKHLLIIYYELYLKVLIVIIIVKILGQNFLVLQLRNSL